MVKIYFSLDDDGYVYGGISEGVMTGASIMSLEVDSDHEIFNSDPSAFKYTDGELIKDEQKQQELIDNSQKEESKLSEDDSNSLAILELAEKLYLKGGN